MKNKLRMIYLLIFNVRKLKKIFVKIMYLYDGYNDEKGWRHKFNKKSSSTIGLKNKPKKNKLRLST